MAGQTVQNLVPNKRQSHHQQTPDPMAQAPLMEHNRSRQPSWLLLQVAKSRSVLEARLTLSAQAVVHQTHIQCRAELPSGRNTRSGVLNKSFSQKGSKNKPDSVTSYFVDIAA